MDIQKVKVEDIQKLTGDVTIDITGKIVIPASWIYYQMKLKNIQPLDVNKLRETLGGCVIFDIMVNAKRDQKGKSFLKLVDLVIMDTAKGIDRFVECDGRVRLTVNGKQVNDIDFKRKLSDNWYRANDPEKKPIISLNGEFEHEANFNSNMLKMVKPYGVRLKSIAVVKESSELFS